MRYLLFLIPFLTFAQVTEKKFGDIRVREIIPVLSSGSTFTSAVSSTLPDSIIYTTELGDSASAIRGDFPITDTTHYVTFNKVIGLQDSLDNYTLVSDLDSLITTSPIKDSVLNIVTDALEDSSFTEDLRTPVSSIRLPGSGAPQATAYLGGEVLSFPTNADATIYFEVQMPHDRELNSNINIHLHYTLSADGTNPDSVRWVLTYTWANIDAQFAQPTTETHTEYVSSSVDSTHYYDVIATLTGTGKTLSSMLICSLTRDVSEDDYAGSVYLLEIDVHYQRRNYTSPQSLF